MADLLTPIDVEFETVDYMKFKPGVKVVVGPEIAVVIASCNTIPPDERVYKRLNSNDN